MKNRFSTGGIRSVVRQDGLVLLHLHVGPKEKLLDLLGEHAEHPLTLTPNGRASILLSDAEADTFFSLPPNAALPRCSRNLSLFRISGVCMSGSENKAGRIFAALSQADIEIRFISLCDLALAIAVDTADAGRTMDIICRILPLTACL